jgi:hypothetical protein
MSASATPCGCGPVPEADGTWHVFHRERPVARVQPPDGDQPSHTMGPYPSSELWSESPASTATLRVEACIDLAEVLRLSGRRREAARELHHTVAFHRRQGNDVGERHAPGLRTEIGEGPVGELARAPAIPEENGTGGPETDRQQQPHEDESVAKGEPSPGTMP